MMCSHQCLSDLLQSTSIQCFSSRPLGNKCAETDSGCSRLCLSFPCASWNVTTSKRSESCVPAAVHADRVRHSLSSSTFVEQKRGRRWPTSIELDRRPVNLIAHQEGRVQLAARKNCVRSQSTAVNEMETVEMGLRTYQLTDLSPSELKRLLARPRINFDAIFGTVLPIVEDVRARGDSAVQDFTEKFDGVRVEHIVERIEDMEEPELDADVAAAFDVAFENIKTFHTAQKKTQPLEVETMPGVVCKRVARAIESVGLYIPGGTAVLPSTALMLAVPAGIAGCRTIVVATPPRKDGSIAPEVLYCAKKAGATHLLKAGGAQAVAAMAWGTATCPKVDKILGPGNQYVTAAKMALQNSEAMVSIDMPAGPSEVLVIADKGASHVHVASDLLSQAEHGPDSQVVLVVVGKEVDVAGIDEEVIKQCKALPRAEIAAKALSHSYCVVVDSMEEACRFSNMYAPEHLIVNTDDAEEWLPHLDNAGSVFLGRWTPESVGDYASGTNHVLPTYGYARMYGGVSLDSFVKYMTVQMLSQDGLKALGPSVAKMAEVEGLSAHQRAVTLRLASIP